MPPRVALSKSVSFDITRHFKCLFGCSFLTKTGRRRTPKSSDKDRRSPTDDPPGDGGPDEAVAFIAETVADLARLARRHKLELLVRLLEMAEMEARERIRLRGKRNLS
jgi:hypothetical protein